MGRRKFLSASLAACSLGAAGLAGWQLWRRDPDAAEKDIERRLARGESVPLLGSGPTSQPAWSRVVLGTGLLDRSDNEDRACRFFSTGGMLELLRDPQLDRYVFRAEVRHETDQQFGAVGLYLGRRSYSTSMGDIHVFVQVGFNDISSRRDQIRHWNADHPQEPQRAVPEANALRVNARLWRLQAGSSDAVDNYSITSKELFQPNWKWRHWPSRSRRKKSGSRGRGTSSRRDSFPPAQVGDVIETALAAPANPNPFPGGAIPTFTPRGSLGLFAYEGAASFRNLRVGPPDPVD